MWQEPDEKKSLVYFTSTAKEPDGTAFLSRVALLGGAPLQLTHDHGTHNVDLSPDFHAFSGQLLHNYDPAASGLV